ncbi:unnamed protein product [Spirodela intermedia]|uniref:Saposin B-type domain-containing protein n=1 Tax=Spirodela intermedia TaxID=51605 RepID=A0A7I8LG43_SPIIN|nr:unnamed protein product [Spirodela intermedia]
MKSSWSVKIMVAPFVAGMLFLVASAGSAKDSFAPIAGHAGRSNPLDDPLTLDELAKFFAREDPDPSPNGYPENYCHSCLEISRKAEKILSDPGLLKEIDYVVSTVCELVPSGFQAKCAKMVEMYKTDAIMFLQDAFLEQNFCNNTGICSNLLFCFRYNLQSNATCTACLSILGKIRSELEDPDKQLKIITSLLKACEAEVFVYKCKKLIFAYGPIVITNIQKVASMDLCHMVQICRNPMNKTVHWSVADSQPHIKIAPARLDAM